MRAPKYLDSENFNEIGDGGSSPYFFFLNFSHSENIS